jgi:hypothetical protein
MRIVSAFLAVSTALCPAAAFAQKQPPLPPEIAAQRAADVADCKQDGGAKADFTGGESGAYLQRGNFNGDALPDFVVFHGALACVGDGFTDRLGCAASSGCTFYTFVSLPNGKYQKTEGWMVESAVVAVRPKGDVLVINETPHAWSGRDWKKTR